MASRVQAAEELPGNRHDLQQVRSPDAPETSGYAGNEGAFGYVHSLETGSLVDGPGVRATLFLAGCLLRCRYCHNPDTWHLKNGTKISFEDAARRLLDFAPALRALNGGLTLSGGEPLVQRAFAERLFALAKKNGIHTALDTSGFLGARATEAFLEQVDLILLDIKSIDTETYRSLTGAELRPTLEFAERLARIKKPVWIRYVLVPGITDRRDHIRDLGKFLRDMDNVEWIEVLPFHQLGAFKWKALGLDYTLENTTPAWPELAAWAVQEFKAMGCRAR